MRDDEIYAKAVSMFEAHNRAKGALMPGGFGFMSKKQQAPWLNAARKILSEMI